MISFSTPSLVTTLTSPTVSQIAQKSNYRIINRLFSFLRQQYLHMPPWYQVNVRHQQKTLPKALRTQALTALTSNFGVVDLVWKIWFGKLGLVGLVLFGQFGLVGLVW